MIFTYERIQRGSWGSTILGDKTITVKADDAAAADAKVNARKDSFKTLRNGDRLSWRRVQ